MNEEDRKDLAAVGDTPESRGEPEDSGVGGKSKKKAGRKGSFASEIYDIAGDWMVALVVVVVLFCFVSRLTTVDGRSMEPTLHNNDRLIVWSLGYDPTPGDVIVLTEKSFDVEPLVKRVIAVGGQTVDVNYETDQVIVDGIPLDEPYINESDMYNINGMMATAFPLTLEEGQLLVFGDNRNNSTDSRNVSIGTVDERVVFGKVIFRIFPFDKIGVVH